MCAVSRRENEGGGRLWHWLQRRAAAGAAHLHPMTSQIICSDAAAAPSAARSDGLLMNDKMSILCSVYARCAPNAHCWRELRHERTCLLQLCAAF